MVNRFKTLLLLGWALCACGASSVCAQSRPLLVCSTTQVADFARQVVGDACEVQCILAAGTDPHLYQVTSKDLELIKRATLCLENGWHLEGNDWLRTSAKDAGKPVVTCVEGIQPIQLEGNGESVRDPHAWFTPQNAAMYVRNIAKGVARVDPAKKEYYEARADLYLEQLRSLHVWIQRQCNKVPASRRVLVTSHDAFNYFCKQYGFRSAAPVGWSTGSETGAGPDPAKRKETVESIRSFGVKAIFVESTVNPTLIEEIAKEAGVQVGGQLYSDSMGVEDSAGESYIGMMSENVLRIVNALQ